MSGREEGKVSRVGVTWVRGSLRGSQVSSRVDDLPQPGPGHEPQWARKRWDGLRRRAGREQNHPRSPSQGLKEKNTEKDRDVSTDLRSGGTV